MTEPLAGTGDLSNSAPRSVGPADAQSVELRVADGRRLAALRQSHLLDTPPEPEFDRLTALAQRVLGVPTALLSLVDLDRQFFKSQQGLAEPFASQRETPLSHSFCKHVVASDAPLVVADARAHPLVHDNIAVTDLGVIAYLGAPIHSVDGQPLGALCAISGEPRAWTDDDMAVLLDLVAVVESEIALRAELGARTRAEATYQALFEASPDAVLVLDPETETVLDANAPARALYGRTHGDLVGSTMKGASPDASTGEAVVARMKASGGSAQFESVHRRHDGTLFDVAIRASLVDLGDRTVILSVNRDVTTRNRAEAALRVSASRAAFREALSDALRPLADPVDVQIEASRVLGEHLGASRTFYAEVKPDGDHITVTRDYCDGVPSMTGTYALSDYGPVVAACLTAGLPLVIEDVRTDGGLTAEHRNAYSVLGICGYVSFPLVKEGRLVAMLVVHQSTPRAWTQDEIALVGETAERTWSAVERATAESASRASEERFRLLADTATDVILTIDASSTIRYANRAAEAVFGYAPAELVGTALPALIPAGLRSRHRAGVGRYIETGERTLPRNQLETRGLRKDGTEFPVSVSFGEYTVGEERLFTGIIRDTTAQKAAQEALLQSEARFRQIAEVLPQLVWTALPDGTHNFNNGRWNHYTGSPLSRWEDTVHPDDRAESTVQWTRALATGEPYDREHRLRRASDGAYRWFIGRAEPLRNDAGAIVGWFGTSTDVHDLHEAQERLRAKGEQLRLVHRATTDVVWDWDAASGVLVWGPAVVDVLGWDEALVGTDLDWWKDRLHPDDRSRVALSFDTAAKGDAPVWQEEYRFRRADGTYAFVLDRAYVVRDDKGAVVRVVGAMVDLSERKAVELELVAAREAAETAARLKSSLLANMSHEIRTPLTAILGYAEMLADEAPPDLLDLVEPIGRGGRRLMDTLNSVLDLAQIDAGEVALSATPVDLLAEVNDACAALRPLAGAKGLDLRVVGESVWALADRPALGRVLTNLVGNAVKFTDRGSVTVEAGGDAVGAWVRVSDTGVGIAAEFLPALFSEFKQESEGHGRAYEGNGLGLAITQRLAGLMGGEIAVVSEKGVGSTFTVRLPLAAESA